MQEIQCYFVKTNLYRQILDVRTRLVRAATFCPVKTVILERNGNCVSLYGYIVVRFFCGYPMGRLEYFFGGFYRCFSTVISAFIGCVQLFISSLERACR